jgi:hypothetical protein
VTAFGPASFCANPPGEEYVCRLCLLSQMPSYHLAYWFAKGVLRATCALDEASPGDEFVSSYSRSTQARDSVVSFWNGMQYGYTRKPGRPIVQWSFVISDRIDSQL